MSEIGINVEACDGNGWRVDIQVNYFGGSRKVQAEYVWVLASQVGIG